MYTTEIPPAVFTTPKSSDHRGYPSGIGDIYYDSAEIVDVTIPYHIDEKEPQIEKEPKMKISFKGGPL